MNIFKRECRVNFKVFLFWSMGLFVLIFAGMAKYTGLESYGGGAGIDDLLNQFPKVVLAMFGMSGLDIKTPQGFYGVIFFYSLICGIIYAVHLGANAVTREAVDKTYEFIFTKPCSKSHVLAMKILAGWFAIAGFSILTLVFSLVSFKTFKIEIDNNQLFLLFSLGLFIISSLFYVFSIFFATISKKADKGTLYGNLCFLFAFIMSIVYDMIENGRVIKWISPLKYFETQDLIEGKLDVVFLIFSLFLMTFLLVVSFWRFEKNDLMA